MIKRIVLVLAGAVVAAAIGAGIAVASIPGPDGVIHGCYKTGNPNQGSVIAIDSSATCPNGYTALNWTKGYTYYRVSSGPFSVPAQGGVNAAIGCNNVADQLISGGADNDNGATDLYMFMGGSFPMADGRWQVQMSNTDPVNSHSFNLYALCAHAG